MSEAKEIHDFVCTACGCTCDDLTLAVDNDRVIALSPPCPLAEKFLLAEHTPLDPVDVDASIERAAEILRAARAPMVMGFARATVAAQRLAVEIADDLGGDIVATDDCGVSASHVASQTVGVLTATWGEIASRSDFVVYWECDPATTHPRHMERFANRAGQRTVVVAQWPTPSAALADEYLLIPAGSGVECLATLRALVRGLTLDPQLVELRTGNALSSWQRLADQLTAARYAALIHDASRSDLVVQSVTELARDLHRYTRAAVMSLGAAFNAAGAAQVLSWQTGFPAAVSFAHGHPRYQPSDAVAARLLARREVDAALIIAADPLPHLPAAAAAHLRSIPTIVIDDRRTPTAQSAAVVLPSSRFGIETAGDVYRSDGVCLSLRAATPPSAPSMEEILSRLADRLKSGEGASPAVSGVRERDIEF